MNKCTNCGSHAINPHMHGRGGDNLGLCDVCYWRTRFDALREAVAWERECDECGEWLHRAWWDRNELNLGEIEDLYDCARAEVDRLLLEETK